MPEVFDVHQQWLDSNRNFLVGGKVYYGVPNTDPTIESNKVNIYSDRALTIQLPNPQTIGVDGRVENKPWIGGNYAIEVYSQAGVLIFSNPDNGATITTTDVIPLSNVQGINDLTAETPGGITQYSDLELYTLRTVAGNTGAMTVNIDNVQQVPLKINGNDLIDGDIAADTNILFSFNSEETRFDLQSQAQNITVPLMYGQNVNINTSTVVAASQDGFTFVIDASSSQVNMTLPEITALLGPIRYAFVLIDNNSGANVAKVIASGTDLIDEVSEYTLTNEFSAITVVAVYSATLQNRWVIATEVPG